MKTKILNILRHNPNEYISGQELCKQMEVSRTAIWKVINQLKEEGYEIEAIQNKGYKLFSCPDILSKSEIESRLVTKWAGKTVVCLDETGSTNSDIKKKAEEGAPHGMLLLADKQLAGRGRRGREWEQPKGHAIAMSILLRPTFPPEKASALTLVMALSVARAIKEVTSLECKIKWPNDLLVNDKKVCGILTEMNAEADYIHYVVIGIGINVTITEFPEEIKEKATSLVLEGKETYRRAEIVAATMKYFERDYETFLKTLDLSLLEEEYNSLLLNKEKAVRVLDPMGAYEGVAKGINIAGELLVEKKGGELITVYAGEVSVRGLCGYI